MKTTLACLAATLLAVPIWAAECVAEWTDFSSEHLTSGAMTLDLNGNTHENGYAEIGTAPLLITGTAAWNPRNSGDNPTNTPLTLVLRFSNLTNDDTLTELQALVSLTLGTSDNMVGLMTRVGGGAPVGMWSGNSYTSNATMSALPSDQGEYILVFTYGESGTQAWVLENGAWNARFTCGGLRGGGTVGGKIALGAKTDGTLPATGLRIHAVSVWKGALSESERNGAVALLTARERTLAEGRADWQAANAWGEGVSAPSANEAARLTLTGDATLTMNAAASVGALAVDGEGTLRFAPDTAGNTLTSPLTLVNANVDATSGVASLGAVSIAAGKTLTVSTTPSLAIATGANAGTLQVIGGSEASPVVLSAGNVLNADIGQVELAENTTLRLHATGGNKVYRVRGAGSSSVLLLTSAGQGWGLTANGTALDNLTLVIPATVDGTTANANFWMTPGKTTSTVHFRTERQITGENAAGTFDFASIAGSGNFLGAGRHLRISDGANAVYSGVFSGTDSFFVKTGEGTQTLSGANTYTGGTTIEGGILKLTDGGVPGTGTVTINSGTLEVAANASKTLANAFSGVGAIVKTGTGTASLTGNLSGFTGAVTVAGGTLDVSTATFGETKPTFAVSAGELIATAGNEGTVTVSAGATLKLKLSAAQLLSGYDASRHVTLEGEGETKGKVVFVNSADQPITDGVNGATYTSPLNTWTPSENDAENTWANASRWSKESVPAEGDSVRLRITGDATLTVESNVMVADVSIEGEGTLTLNGEGCLTVMNRVVTYVPIEATPARLTCAALDVMPGVTLALPSNTSPYAFPITLEAGATLSPADGVTVSGVISGAGGVAIEAGTVTFSGTNTYSGGTTIAEDATLSMGSIGNAGGSGAVIAVTGTLKFTTSSTILAETGIDLHNITGTGTVHYEGTGWRTFPDNALRRFSSELAVRNDQADGLIITEQGASSPITTIGTVSGARPFRVDWNGGGRTLRIVQAKNSEHTGNFVYSSYEERLTEICIAGAEGATQKTLTLSGETTTTARPLEVEASGSLRLDGKWNNTVTVSGTIGGSGTIGNTLTFEEGSTLDISAGALKVTGAVSGSPTLSTGNLDLASVGGLKVLGTTTAELTFQGAPEGYVIVMLDDGYYLIKAGSAWTATVGAETVNWSDLQWTDGTITLPSAIFANASLSAVLNLDASLTSATVIYDVVTPAGSDASAPNLAGLTIGAGVTLNIPETAPRNFTPSTVTNNGELVICGEVSGATMPAYSGKVEFKNLTVTNRAVGNLPDHLVVREGDTVRFTGTTVGAGANGNVYYYSAPEITMTGGTLEFATGASGFWLGAMTTNAQTVNQSGGTVIMGASTNPTGTGNGLLLGFGQGKTMTYNLSGGALDISNNFLNYSLGTSVNVSGTGVLKMKGAFRCNTPGTLTLSDNGRIELTGAQGLPAGVLSTFTLNGGTLAATANTSIAANATVSGTVALEAAQGATMTVSGALTGAATLEKTGEGTVVLTGSALNGFTGTFKVEAGALQVPSTCTATITVAAGGALKVPVSEDQASSGYTYENANLRLTEGVNVTFVLPDGREVEGEGNVLPALTYYKWTPDASNNWSEVNNWTYMLDGTHALPPENAQVVIDATAAAQTVTMDTDATVALTVKGSNPVTIAGERTLTIKGSEDEADPRIVAGDLRISGHLATSGHVYLDISLPSKTYGGYTGSLMVADGTLTLKTSTPFFFSGASIMVATTAKLTMANLHYLLGNATTSTAASTMTLHGTLNVGTILVMGDTPFDITAGAMIEGTGSLRWMVGGAQKLNVLASTNGTATTVDIEPTLSLGGGAQLHLNIADGVTLNVNGGLSPQSATEGTKLFVNTGTMALKGSGATFTHPVEIGAEATVEVYPLTVEASLQANTLTTGAISGSGQLVIKSVPIASTFGLTAEGWTGTVKFDTARITGLAGLALAAYGNAGSTIILKDTGATLATSDGETTIASRMVLEGAVTLFEGTSDYTFGGALSGTGDLTLRNGGNADCLKFTGDCSDFAGAITVADGRCIAFGSGEREGTEGKIVVGTDGNVTIAEGKTWTAANGVAVNGTIGGAGTIGSALTLANGATLNATAGALTVTGMVTLPTAGTVTVRASAPGVVLNARGLDATKFALAEGASANLTLVATDSALVAVEVPEAETPMEAVARVAIAQAAAARGVTSVTAVEGNADAAALFTGVVSVAPSAEDPTQGTATVAYDFGIQSLTIRLLTVGEATEPALYVVLAAKVQGAEGVQAGYLGSTAVKVYRVGPETDEAGKPVLTEIDGQVSAGVLPGASGTEQPGVKWIYFPYANLDTTGSFYFKVKASSETP